MIKRKHFTALLVIAVAVWAEMMQIYRILRANFNSILRKAGATSPFNARVFRDLCVLASAAAEDVVVSEGALRGGSPGG
jgi:hypothetical protein